MRVFDDSRIKPKLIYVTKRGGGEGSVEQMKNKKKKNICINAK